MTKFCVDCKWLQTKWPYAGLCAHPILGKFELNIDLVSGHLKPPTAMETRKRDPRLLRQKSLFLKKCGKEAAWWEPKDA